MPKNNSGNVPVTGDLHKGYNENNPTQPQGAFAADSVQKDTVKPGKKKSLLKLKKRKTKMTGKTW